MGIVLGIDVGTQSSKVLFYDYEQRTVIASASRKYDVITSADGTSEQEAQFWTLAIQRALAEVPRELRRSIVAVGVSGQQHGFVPVGKNGEVLYRVKLWNDTSTVEECNEISTTFGGERALIHRVGNPLLPGYTGSKILWLKKNQPELFTRLAHIMLPHDYINFVLTGNISMEYGDASGTGLLNIAERTWNRELCEIIDINLPRMLPKLSPPEVGAGFVSKEAAELFDIPIGIPVSSGGGDNMMAAIGTGSVRDQSLTMSLGTSGTLFSHSSTPVIDTKGIVSAFCSSTGGWLPLICTMNCTVATEKTRKLFGFDISAMESCVSEAPAGCNGITVLPFFSGERMPNMPEARASIMGISASNYTPANIMRASMEAAIFAMKMGLEHLHDVGIDGKCITLTGGGSRSPAWQQLASDIIGLSIIVPAERNAAALGAAIQALWFEGVQRSGNAAKSIEELVDDIVLDGQQTIVEPGPNHKVYEHIYEQYRKYLKAIQTLYT